MRYVALALVCAYAAGCSRCDPPQAITSNKELDTTVATSLKSLPNLPEIEFRTQFKRKVDEVFKNTPGVDVLDIMLYRVCVIGEQHKNTITAAQLINMEKEAYKAWLTYIRGTEKVVLERVKVDLAGQPLGPVKFAGLSGIITDQLQDRVRKAVMRAIELGVRADAAP